MAVEQDEEVSVMLELMAPAAADERPPAAVQIVLDRSGSLDGERLEAASAPSSPSWSALTPTIAWGVVAFDDEVRVVVPAGRVADQPAARHAIAALEAGGRRTSPAACCAACRRHGDRGRRGLNHAFDLRRSCQRRRDRPGAARGGRGSDTGSRDHNLDGGDRPGYDELLLAELARGGQGNHVFAERGDAAVAAVAGEVDGLLSKTVQAASLVVRPDAPVATLTLWNDLPAAAVEGGVMVELGDLWASERRRVILTLAVPAKPALGLARVAELELRYVAVPELVEQTITVPVHVNVVPGDQAAGRIPDPEVRTELAYQQVQAAKRRAADALRDGDHAAATAAYDDAGAQLDALTLASASPETAEEQAIIAQLRERTATGEAAWAAKFARMDQSRKSRKRGRGDLGM
jgi:Ca-activated chloride channel homolog